MKSIIIKLFDYLNLIRFLTSLSAAALSFSLSAKYNLLDNLSIIISTWLFCIMAGIFIINSITDINSDKINTPTRAIAKGSIDKKSACYLLAFFLAISVVMIFLSPVKTALIMIIDGVLGILYSYIWKTNKYLKNLGVALLCASIVALTTLGRTQLSNDQIVISSIIFFFLLQKEIISDVRDIFGDKLTGNVTMAMSNKKVAFFLVIIANLAIILLLYIGYHSNYESSWFKLETIILMIINCIYSAYTYYCYEKKAAAIYIKFSKLIFIVSILNI